MIIGIFGFPNSGKTVYTWEFIYYKLLKDNRSFFIQRANPDGDRPLSSRGMAVGEQWLGGVFDQKFVNWVIESALNLSKNFEFVYLDTGGMQSQENQEIIKICDEAIVIGRNENDLKSWQDFIINTKKIPVKFYLSSIEFEEKPI